MVLGVVLASLLGIAAGLCIRYFYRNKSYFNFTGFEESAGRDTDPNLLLRFLKNLGRNVKTTGPMFLFGVLLSGMSMGSASAFMITGPATKITNLGALKIVLGARRFALYLAFVILFSLVTGLLVDLMM